MSKSHGYNAGFADARAMAVREVRLAELVGSRNPEMTADQVLEELLKDMSAVKAPAEGVF